ncbi:MAG: serine hydrolase domain-containing protein [Bacillota bacterium]
MEHLSNIYIFKIILIEVIYLKNAASLITDYLKDYSESFSISGNVLVSIKGNIAYHESFGFANEEHKVLNDFQTKFRIASITKQFTATLILLLQEKGFLSIDDKITKYLSNYKGFCEEITIHQLLTHTSGIPDYYDCVENFFEREDKLNLSRDEFISLYKNEPLDFAPGTDWKYSNSGYHLLGVIIENVTGENFNTVLKEMILSPLKMNDTGCETDDILRFRASGYVRKDKKVRNAPYVHMSKYSADGGMYSTTLDLLKWEKALHSNAILTKKSLEKMHHPYSNNYGYGWFVDNKYNRSRILHSGRISGFSGHFVRYFDERVTIITLGNYEGINWHSISDSIAAIIFGEAYPSPKKIRYSISPETLEMYLGEYKSNKGLSGRRLTVTNNKERIYFQWNDNDKFEVYPISETSFRRLSDEEDEVHTFIREKNVINIWEYSKIID